MKACSFVPAATSLLYAMELDDLLYGVTFECPGDKPHVVRSMLEGHTHSSAEIDRITAAAAREGRSLYTVDLDLLRRIAPDLVFTQGVCDVCQISTSYAERAIAALDPPPRVIPLAPRTLDDVYDNALTIARALDREAAGLELVAGLRQRTGAVLDTLRAHGAPLRRVTLLEWMDPIYSCGHWIPYQIAQAGAVDMLANPGGYSIPIAWEKLVLYDPEVIVVAPCGFDVARARTEADVLTRQPGWGGLTAVQRGAVYLADGDLFTQPSDGLVDGIELLAALFHPQIFVVPEPLRARVLRLADAGRAPAAAASEGEDTPAAEVR
jgi:iron complex transport system substrate-binding protein